MKNNLFIGIIAAIGLFACTTQPKKTIETSMESKSAPIVEMKVTKTEELAMGKNLFENSCAKCHALPELTKYDTTEWVGIMNKMAPKAHFTDAQHQLVYNYVTSAKP
jgi:hypothetical protein